VMTKHIRPGLLSHCQRRGCPVAVPVTCLTTLWGSVPAAVAQRVVIRHLRLLAPAAAGCLTAGLAVAHANAAGAGRPRMLAAMARRSHAVARLAEAARWVPCPVQDWQGAGPVPKGEGCAGDPPRPARR